MSSNAELVAEARDHIEAVAESLPEKRAQAFRAGGIEDLRLNLIVRLADALAATLPKKTARYVTVRPAEHEPEVGELVQSKFSPNGTVWRIEGATPVATARRRSYLLNVVSLSSGRRGSRFASNMLIVEALS